MTAARAVRVSDSQRRVRLAWTHRLTPAARAQDPAEIADGLVALHSSDPVSVYLSVCARQVDPSIASVEAALYDDRSLLRHHAMRRTMWVMTPTVTRLAHASCTRKLAAAERRRLVRMLRGDEAWLNAAAAEMSSLLASAGGPLTARQIGQMRPWLTRKLVYAPGTRNETRLAAHSRVLMLGAFEARFVRARPLGSWIGSQYGWTLMGDWTDTDFTEPSGEDAAGELATRWLQQFGPALPEDFMWWSGWTKTAARKALKAAGAVPVALDCGEGVAPPGYEPCDEPEDWAALLPCLDPTAMGWKQRSWYLDSDIAARVTDRSGNIGPTVWVDGRIVGGWVQRSDGEIATEILRHLDTAHRRLVDAEIERLRAAVSGRRFRVRFPSPNQRSLLS